MSYIFIEDHVVPQIFTSAIEAYEILHKKPKGKGTDKLETFGLLWGYSIQAKGNQEQKIIVTMAKVETSATRHNEWVSPDFKSLCMKKEFLENYWPNIELVGSFHSHPYKDLTEVTENTGWQASKQVNNKKGDEQFFPYFHQEVAPEQENLVHLIVTITHLRRNYNSKPSRLANHESSRGYVLSAKKRRIWLRAYRTISTDDSYEFKDDCILEIPSLQPRFS